MRGVKSILTWLILSALVLSAPLQVLAAENETGARRVTKNAAYADGDLDEGDVTEPTDNPTIDEAVKVQRMLETLPDPATAADEEQVKAARAAYDALTEEQKNMIYDKNPDAIAKLEKAEADIVSAKIEALPDPAAAADEEQVKAVRAAYDALSDEQKKMIDDSAKAKLEKAETDIVSAKIEALPDSATAADEEQVKAARAAYDALSDEQKKMIDDSAKAKLEKAEAEIVKAKIEALPDNVGTADAAAVEELRKAYDALSDEQKAALGEDVKKKLEEAEKKVAQATADAKAADDVKKLIDAIPAVSALKYTDKKAVEDAAKAYDALSDAQKQQIPADVRKKLEDAKSAMAAMDKEEQAEEAAGHETLAAFDKKVTSSAKEDLAGTEFGKLQVKVAKKVGNNMLKAQWKKVSGAAGYVIYANKAGKKNKYVKVGEVKGKNTFTLKKIKGKKIKKNTYYKILVAAYKTTKGGTVRVIAKAKPVYAATNGGKNGNPTKLTVKKLKVNVKVKKSFKLKVKQAKPKGKKIVKKRAVMFESSDKKIATVSKKGVIKGKKAGKCKIYVYAQNGLMKTVKVTVKKK